MVNYEGHILKSKHGTAKYRCICRDWFGGWILQSCRSPERLLLVKTRRKLEENWEIWK